MCFTYDEYCEVWNETFRRSRQTHGCDSCFKKTIIVGRVYCHISGINDGNPFTLRICARCLYQREKIHEHEIAEGCRDHESWIAVQEVGDYMLESGMAWADESEAVAFCEAAYGQQNEERKSRRLAVKGGA